MKRLAVLCALMLCYLAEAQQKYTVEVVRDYPHDAGSYTQGLFFHDGRLMETTGQYGKSTLREVDLATGDALVLRKFSKSYFAEGSVVFDGTLYVLTWTNRQIFAYDPETLQYRCTYNYPREGWGLTTDGECLIASDGSDCLYFLDRNLRPVRTLKVRLNGKPVRLLNELEWIGGKIWANVYTTDTIVVIDPSSGEVESTVDCTGLLPDSLRTAGTDVLNGIACSGDGRIYLTGKNWPRLYEVRLKALR